MQRSELKDAEHVEELLKEFDALVADIGDRLDKLIEQVREELMYLFAQQLTSVLVSPNNIFISATTVRRRGRVRLRAAAEAGDGRPSPDLGEHLHPGGHAQAATAAGRLIIVLPPLGLVGAGLR